MAVLQTKWVDVGVYSTYGITITGVIMTGSVSNTQNGSSDVNLDSVFSGADIVSFFHASTTSAVSLGLSGNRANSTFDTLKIGGVSFARTSATHSYNSSNNITTWTWSSVTSSPFGTTVGADKEVTWETTVTSDGTPDPYTFQDVTASLSTVSYTSTQIVGINTTATVSRITGGATFAVSSSGSTTPNSSAFSAANKNITNNQYIWLKQTSSSSNSTTLTSVFSTGGVTATWQLTTVAASGGGGAYGLQVFPPSGTIPRLDTSDRTARVLAVFTGTLAAGGSSSTFTQTGFSSSDITIAVEWQTSGDPQYVSLSSSGTSLTVTRANDPSSFSNTYQVRIFRI